MGITGTHCYSCRSLGDFEMATNCDPDDGSAAETVPLTYVLQIAPI